MLVLFCVLLIHNVYSKYTISVYGDVYKDKEFFTKSFPWIIEVAIQIGFDKIVPSVKKLTVFRQMGSTFLCRTYLKWDNPALNNIGGDIMVDFNMQGSGRYTVPQMCALTELRDNTFLQAQFLKCEAEGYPSQVCLCESGIDSYEFRQCVRNGGFQASASAARLLQLGIDVTPLIELGPRSTVFGVADTWYLKKICTIFGDDLPRGCLKPFACNGTEQLNKRRAISQFDKCCKSMECIDSDDISTTLAPATTWAM